MKKLTLIFALAAILFGFTGANARTYALLVGVSKYDVEDANLAQSAKDAKIFRDVLLKQTPNVTILTSKFANRDNILEKLRALCNRAQKGDCIIFYFSGHGDNGMLLPSDLRPLYYSDIVSAFSGSAASRVVCYIDACFAGSVSQTVDNANRNTSSSLKPKDGHIYFVSSRGDETSREAAWIGQSYFTQALVKGYRGKCDYNGDRKVTVKELFKYIHSDVVRRSDKGQHPMLIAPKDMMDCVLVDWNEIDRKKK